MRAKFFMVSVATRWVLSPVVHDARKAAPVVSTISSAASSGPGQPAKDDSGIDLTPVWAATSQR